MPRRLEIRCEFCRFHPILAITGRDDETGEPFLHIKSYKQSRVYVEIVVLSGTVMIKCRDCYHWHKLTIRRSSIEAVPEPLPASVTI